MTSTGELSRSKSLKRMLSRSKLRSRPRDEEEPLPCRPVKHVFAQYHITSDDIGLRPYPPLTTDANGPPPPIPLRHASRQRNTWPTVSGERKAGSYAFDTVPTLVRTPWEMDRSARRPQTNRTPLETKPLPRRVFEQLPREIYRCITDHLERLYWHGSVVDVPGRNADLRSLLLVDKRWHRVAREHVYREIWLPNDEEPLKRPFGFGKPKSRSRLAMLLRTLGESPGLASLVRHLRITADLAITLELNQRYSGARRAAYDNLIQVISNCPNLEHLSGYSPAISDDLSIKLAACMSQRANLKSWAWNVAAAQLGAGALRNFTAGDLIDNHCSWYNLHTLVISSSPDLTLGSGTPLAILDQLPSLQHLMLSNLSRHDFHNGSLTALPPLTSLRLDHLEGLTDQGLDQLSLCCLSTSLRSLSLIGLELTSLRSIQTLLLNMPDLHRLTLVQDTAPEFQPGIESASTLQGLESSTLEYLHWDVLIPGSATTLIANSIASGRFPSLRKVKIPCDHDGSIQALCRPIAHQPLTASDLELLDRHSRDERYERYLRLSQFQAQLRVRQSRQQPSFNVVIQDEDQSVKARHVIGSFLGRMESRIEYDLSPDVEGSFYALADWADVRAPRAVYERANEMGRSGFRGGEQVLGLEVLF